MAAPEARDGVFSKEYLEEGIARLREEDGENPTPETKESIGIIADALENLEA